MLIIIKMLLGLFGALLLPVIYANSNEAAAPTSLWDHIVKMEQIILNVEYHGRRLNVWQEHVNGYNRFFVTPLCVMDTSSVKCVKDKFSSYDRYAFSFYVQLWDNQAAKLIQLALKQNGIETKTSDIIPLPMQKVKLSINRDELTSKISLDNNRWISNQGQPNRILFELGINNKEFCDELVKDANSDPEGFLAGTKLFFKFTMVVNGQASRNLNVTGKNIANSKFFSNLDNFYSNKKTGDVYLQSKDLNDLSRDIYRTVAVSDELTSDYIEADRESEIIMRLFDEIKGQQIDSDELTKDQWNSVFWDDIFARPDIQTEYFNESLTYDSDLKHFKYDEGKDREFRERTENRFRTEDIKKRSGGGGFSFFNIGLSAKGATEDGHSEGKEDIKDIASRNVTIISKDELEKRMDINNANVKWSGTSFVPKDLTLYRINTKALKNSGEVFYTKVITTKLATIQELQILPDSGYKTNDIQNPVQFEALQTAMDDIQNKTDARFHIIAKKNDEIKEKYKKFENLLVAANAEIKKNNENFKMHETSFYLANEKLESEIGNVKKTVYSVTGCSNTIIRTAISLRYGDGATVAHLISSIGEGPKKPFDNDYVRIVHAMGPGIIITAKCWLNVDSIVGSFKENSIHKHLSTVTIEDGGEFAWEFFDCPGGNTSYWCDVTAKINSNNKIKKWEVYSFDSAKKGHNWYLFNNAGFKGKEDGSQLQKIFDWQRT